MVIPRSVGAEWNPNTSHSVFTLHEDCVGESQTISMSSVVVATKEQVSSDLGGEAVILDTKSGVYHGLDETGARIWSLIQERRPVSDVRDAILSEYDVPKEVCERDVLALLQQLVDKGLAEIAS